MTIGSIFYAPGAKFAFPRSYLYGFSIRMNTVPTQVGRVFTFVDGSNPNLRYTVIVQQEVYDWSSNRYTLDFVLEETYYQFLPNMTKNPLNGCLELLYDQVDERPYTMFSPFCAVFPTRYRYPYPPAPPGYWLPAWP